MPAILTLKNGTIIHVYESRESVLNEIDESKRKLAGDRDLFVALTIDRVEGGPARACSVRAADVSSVTDNPRRPAL